MTQKKVWRYYCDYCRRGGCQKASAAKHERGCVKNPNRECGMCRTAGLEQRPLIDLIAVVDNGRGSLDKLRSETESCPACMLAAIVQGWPRQAYSGPAYDPDGAPMGSDCDSFAAFDFKTEREQFWRDHNDSAYACE